MTKYIDRYYLNGELYGIKFDGGGGGGGGWTPGANTLAYYPLDTDFADQSGNGYDLTNTGGTITTLGGVSCAYFSQNDIASNSIISLGSTRTHCFWFNSDMQNTEDGVMVWTGGDGGVNTKCAVCGLWSGTMPGVGNFYNVGISSGYQITTGTWHLATAVYENGTTSIYVDGVYKNSGSMSLNGGSGIFLSRRGDGVTSSGRYQGYLSGVIIENKAWSAQEIEDYYNQTKDNYQSSTPEPEPQTEQCTVCLGAGEVSCDMCGGTGQEMCPTCSGMGQVGDPEVPESRTECPDCGGAGFVDCGVCGGTGMTTCEHCGGTGEEPLP